MKDNLIGVVAQLFRNSDLLMSSTKADCLYDKNVVIFYDYKLENGIIQNDCLSGDRYILFTYRSLTMKGFCARATPYVGVKSWNGSVIEFIPMVGRFSDQRPGLITNTSCQKCGQEFKQRPLFNTTYFGCLC